MAGGQPPRRRKLSVLLPDRKGRQKRNDDTVRAQIAEWINKNLLGTPCGLNLERHVLDEGTTLAKYADAIRKGGEDKEGWGGILEMAIYAEITGRAVRAYMETTDKRGFRLVSEFGRSTATPLRVVFVGNNHYNELVRRGASAASEKRRLEPRS